MAAQTIGDMPGQRPILSDRELHYDTALIHKRISWPAIFAGVILAVAIQLLLGALGVGVGFGMVHATAGSTPNAASFGVGTGLWWLISNLIALAIGAFVAAWSAGITARFDGVVHGLVTWGIATLVSFYLVSSAIGGLIGGAYNVVGGTLSAAGSTVKAAAEPVAQAAGVSRETVQQQAQAFLQPANPDPASMSPQDAQKAIASELPTFLAGGDGAAPARERIVAIMAAQMHVSPEDAAKRFDDLQARAAHAKEQAVQMAKTAADESARAASTAAYLAFGALLLGAIVAAIAGSIAVQRRTVVSERVVRA